MVDRNPIGVTNLDRYENPVLPWERAHELLESGPKGPLAGFFLGTVGPKGRPHVAGVGVVWCDGDLYFTSGPGTRKSRNLASNPACTIAVKLADLDLTLEGDACRVFDEATLERVATLYQDLGWPAEVSGDAFTAPFSAPSAGPPPWYLYRFVFDSVVALGTAEPHGATRWTFAR
jgi:Pyridoxamine 5'-phosphate oxidase